MSVTEPINHTWTWALQKHGTLGYMLLQDIVALKLRLDLFVRIVNGRRLVFLRESSVIFHKLTTLHLKEEGLVVGRVGPQSNG